MVNSALILCNIHWIPVTEMKPHSIVYNIFFLDYIYSLDLGSHTPLLKGLYMCKNKMSFECPSIKRNLKALWHYINLQTLSSNTTAFVKTKISNSLTR
jgi:hypothetical protein